MGGKLRHYRVFKTEPSPAGYVLAPLGPGQRWALASLRSGCLPLAVETGWYRIPKVPLNQRTCKICNQNCIEDEFNFIIIIECITLQGLREQLILSISLQDASFMHLYNYTKFLYIIQAEHSTAIIAKCVYEMFQLRTSFLHGIILSNHIHFYSIFSFSFSPFLYLPPLTLTSSSLLLL